MLKLIEGGWSAGVMENGQLQVGEEKGTPQGGSVTPKHNGQLFVVNQAIFGNHRLYSNGRKYANCSWRRRP
ncbi:MAG: hypothetical protein IPK04_14940 [Bdellovibrionales bacterium]|nr:hypothetical protein [Bdellovibrionales bacterium]